MDFSRFGHLPHVFRSLTASGDIPMGPGHTKYITITLPWIGVHLRPPGIVLAAGRPLIVGNNAPCAHFTNLDPDFLI